VLLRNMGQEFQLIWWEKIAALTHEDGCVFC
jgi:hypothetical protein